MAAVGCLNSFIYNRPLPCHVQGHESFDPQRKANGSARTSQQLHTIPFASSEHTLASQREQIYDGK